MEQNKKKLKWCLDEDKLKILAFQLEIKGIFCLQFPTLIPTSNPTSVWSFPSGTFGVSNRRSNFQSSKTDLGLIMQIFVLDKFFSMSLFKEKVLRKVLLFFIALVPFQILLPFCQLISMFNTLFRQLLPSKVCRLPIYSSSKKCRPPSTVKIYRLEQKIPKIICACGWLAIKVCKLNSVSRSISPTRKRK